MHGRFFLLALFASVFGACRYGTGNREKIYTPKEFLNHSLISHADRSKDSTQLLKQLKKILENHEQSFHSKEYFELTELMIDTVIYNSRLDKLGVFVISKNPTSRQLAPNPNHDWYYDATCYLGLRKGDTVLLSWLGPNFSNSNNQKELSAIIRDACFTGFATADTTNGGLYKYNLNDKRFWEGAIWNKNFRVLKNENQKK